MDSSYRIKGVDTLETPALVFYEEKIRRNIARIGELLGGFGRLRPHIKTHKCGEILHLQMAAGITRVKCATPKEVRFAAEAGVRDILLAYPIVGPLARRAAALQRAFPDMSLKVLVDHPDQVNLLAEACREERIELSAMVDVNSGMNRTGEALGIRVPLVVAGNSLDFELAAQTEGIDEVSPGTWILWDKGYESALPGLFVYGALVLGRVISRPTPTLFAVDAGYKAVSADPAIPHAHVLSVPGSEVVGRWEEHLLVRLAEPSVEPAVGTPVYVVPIHVCSTVNLWDEAIVVNAQGEVAGRWQIAARGH